ncbi:site-2 protease family protein [bacterium]|nr:MAG: site-2 protease family protein [bacterium]
MDFQQRLIYLILALPAFIAAFTIHEFAHAYVADRLGDDTARRAGKLTLDPFKQLDPIGSLFLVGTILLGLPMIGWASVPVNRNKLRNPRRDDSLVSVAGPLSNVVQAFVWLALLYMLRFAANAAHVQYSVQDVLNIVNRHPDITSPWLSLAAACGIGVTLNLSLAVFNMLPIPPFDGGYIMQNIVPELKPLFDTIRPFSFMIILLLIQAGPILDPIFVPGARFGAGLVLGAMGHDPNDFSIGG